MLEVYKKLSVSVTGLDRPDSDCTNVNPKNVVSHHCVLFVNMIRRSVGCSYHPTGIMFFFFWFGLFFLFGICTFCVWKFLVAATSSTTSPHPTAVLDGTVSDDLIQKG